MNMSAPCMAASVICMNVCECAVNSSFEFILMLYNYEQLLLSL